VPEIVTLHFFKQNPECDHYADGHDNPADERQRKGEERDKAQDVANKPKNESPDQRIFC